MPGDCNIYGGFQTEQVSENSTYWGNIKGDISYQTDLNNILDLKVDKESGKSLSSNSYIVIIRALKASQILSVVPVWGTCDSCVST